MLGPVCARKAQPHICHGRGQIENGERFSARRREMLFSLRKMNDSRMRPDPPYPFGNPLVLLV